MLNVPVVLRPVVCSALVLFPVFSVDVCAEEEEDGPDRSASRKARPEVITFTDEETAQLARIPPQEGATVSERVLVQSAAEKDRISEMKDRRAELEAEPKFANCCSYCPKSFKKPSDLVRWARHALQAWHASKCALSLPALL